MIRPLLVSGNIKSKSELDVFFSLYTSKFYTDYKAIFLAQDMHQYYTLFAEVDGFLGPKTEKEIVGYEILLPWLKQLGVWPKGLSDKHLYRLLTDLCCNKDYLLVEQIIKNYNFTEDCNEVDIDQLVNELGILWLQDKPKSGESVKRSVEYLIANNPNVPFLKPYLYECFYFRLGKIFVLDAFLQAGLQVKNDEKNELLEKIKIWQQENIPSLPASNYKEKITDFLSRLEKQLQTQS